MEINGVNPVVTEIPQYTPAVESEPADEQTPPPAEEVETGVVEQQDDEGAEGVLRLLMEGHFKGVADVRLRINFYEELQALQNQQMAGAAGEEIDGVVEAVDGVLGTLPPAETPQEGAGEVLPEEESLDMGQIQQAFADAVNEAKEEFVNSDEPSQTELVSGLQSAFDSLVQSIRDFFAPPAETGTEEAPEETGGEPELVLEEVGNSETGPEGTEGPEGGEDVLPVELVGEGEPVEEPVFDVEAFIEELTAAFNAALAALTEALNGVSVLPPLSEPSGNGRAYEKFLAIYNDLYGVEPAGEKLNAMEPVETVEPGQLAET